ncbi:hypothetical protein LTR08_005303 [Meristemomyces frigidus]|nr:hypothetical protein LTR08_005303 [Meristemomyces frigidus]
MHPPKPMHTGEGFILHNTFGNNIVDLEYPINAPWGVSIETLGDDAAARPCGLRGRSCSGLGVTGVGFEDSYPECGTGAAIVEQHFPQCGTGIATTTQQPVYPKCGTGTHRRESGNSALITQADSGMKRIIRAQAERVLSDLDHPAPLAPLDPEVMAALPAARSELADAAQERRLHTVFTTVVGGVVGRRSRRVVRRPYWEGS